MEDIAWTNMELLTKFKQKEKSIEEMETARRDPMEIHRHLSKHPNVG